MMIKADIIDLRNLSRELYSKKFPSSTGNTEFLFKVFVCGYSGYCSDEWESYVTFDYEKVKELPTKGLEEIPPELDNKIKINGKSYNVDWLLSTLRFKEVKTALSGTATDIYFNYDGDKTHKVRVFWSGLSKKESQDKLERLIVKRDEI